PRRAERAERPRDHRVRPRGAPPRAVAAAPAPPPRVRAGAGRHPGSPAGRRAALPPLGWPSLADLVAGFEIARSHVPSQLVPRKVGRGTMSATFARLFGADPTTLAAETVLAALPAFWARYHDWGDAEIAVHPGW